MAVMLFQPESVVCVYLIIRNSLLYRQVNTYPIWHLDEGL